MSSRDRATAILEKQRENITLFQAPVRTVTLFISIAWSGLLNGMSRLMRHPAVLYAALPMLAIAAAMSLFIAESDAHAAFSAMDQNGDGVLVESEVSSYLDAILGDAFSVDLLGEWWELRDPGISRETFVAWWAASPMEHPLRHPSRFSGSTWREVEYLIADLLWWLALGILSSVGLGTGMHSGLMFLFPHVYLTCSAADSCRSTDFYTYPTNPFYGPRDRTFHCRGNGAEAAIVGTWARFIKVAPWCVVWGAGTAIGEIPPYALSYAAAKQGKKTSELEEVSSLDVVNRMKNWMLEKIQKYGFWAILALAAWPNMAFDLCGMACGSFLMPFWTFFGATLIGKAFIKVNMQAVFFVLLFSGNNIEVVLEAVGGVVKVLLPFGAVGSGLDRAIGAIHATRTKIAAHARGESASEAEASANLVQCGMQLFVVLMVGWFAKSIVDTFAQQQQEEYDEEVLDHLDAVLARRNRSAANLTDAELEELLDEAQGHHHEASRTNKANAVFAVIAVALFAAGAHMGDALLIRAAVLAAAISTIGAVAVDARRELKTNSIAGLVVRLVIFTLGLVALQ